MSFNYEIEFIPYQKSNPIRPSIEHILTFLHNSKKHYKSRKIENKWLQSWNFISYHIFQDENQKSNKLPIGQS